MSETRSFPCVVLGSCGLAIGLLLGACSSLAGPRPEPPNSEQGEQLSLYIQRASSTPDSATTLVIPGASWMELDLDPLVAAQPTVFYDMRGRGRSSVVRDSEGMSIARDVADLEHVRQQLGLERISLLGWAYGAQVITRYAMRYPERVERMVLVGPLPPKHAEYWQAYLRGYALRFKTADRDMILALRASETKRRNPELYCQLVQEASLRTFVHQDASLESMRTRPWVLPNLDPELSASHAQAILKDLGDWDWSEELTHLELPVLVVHGEHELLPLASSEAYVEALPNARLLWIEGAAHMPWLERPEEFFASVKVFLNADAGQQELAGENR